MLKWTVSQRVPSSVSSNCSDNTPSVACCVSSAFKPQTTTAYKSESQSLQQYRRRSRRSNCRSAAINDKENRTQCRRSLEKELMRNAKSENSVNRDSIYMQLDNVPAALRDVSNKWSPNCENVTPIKLADNRRIKRKSSRLKKSPCIVDKHHCAPVSSTPNNPAVERSNGCLNANFEDKNSEEAQTENILLEKKKQPCINNHSYEFGSQCTELKDTGAEKLQEKLINYQPEISLKKQLSDPKFNEARILSSDSIVVDNPLYFTIQTSPPEEPDLLLHKPLPIPANRLFLNLPNASIHRSMSTNTFPLHPTASIHRSISTNAFSNPTISQSNNDLESSSQTAVNKFISKLNTQVSEVSPLARRLAWLRLTSTQQNLGSPDNQIENLSQRIITDESTTETPDIKRLKEDKKSKIKRKIRRPKRNFSLNWKKENRLELEKEKSENKDFYSKRKCLVFNENFSLNTPTVNNNNNKSSSGTEFVDLDDGPSTLKRQKVIRRPRDWNLEKNLGKLKRNDYNLPLQRVFESCLTLPDGIPSPFNVTKGKFQISSPPLKLFSKGNQNKISNSLESPNLDTSQITNQSGPGKETNQSLADPDEPLSPEIEPLHDSSISSAFDTEDRNGSVSSKRKEPDLVNMSVSPNSELTWNSHENQKTKIPKFFENYLEFINDDTSMNQSTNSSKIQEDQEMYTSTSSSIQTLCTSPMIMVENNSRSRKCLSFVSPNETRRKRMRCSYAKSGYDKGQLDLHIYFENEKLIMHVKRARYLQRSSGELPCNAYVKVNLIPSSDLTKCCQRTCVRKDSCHPKFDHKFCMELTECISDKRILISAWHRDRGNRRSEFLGCMSFAVKNVLKKEINGTYKLLSQIPSTKSQYCSPRQSSTYALDLMASQSESCVEERILTNDTEKLQSLDTGSTEKKFTTITKKEIDKGGREDCMFLQHLELDPVGGKENENKRGGRTPFTTTYKLLKQTNGSFGFSIAWTHPPRVERVEPNLPADAAGLRPGDNVIFVNKTNVVTLPEDIILNIIKDCGNQLTLEIHRKPIMMNGSITQILKSGTSSGSMMRCSSGLDMKSLSVDTDTSKRQLPQVAFSTESGIGTMDSARQQTIFQLLQKEQEYALCLQFGISRFLLPLAERRDVIKPNEHQMLFQNIQELLRITEDVLEQLIQEEGDFVGSSIGKVYFKKLPALNAAYRRYCCGLKKADCILVEKTRNSEFMKILAEPPIPKKRPDLITFIHKPLEHYRDLLKILQTLSNCKTQSTEHENRILSKLCNELRITYREITVESGLMEPVSEGRPLLSLQDMETRLVFTKCKPFVLNIPGRKWIFGGDLNRVDGGSGPRLFWTLLFSDILLFTKINRDRVVFLMDEPLPLADIADTQFNVKKKATEFRLMIASGGAKRIKMQNTENIDQNENVGCVPFHSPLYKKLPSKDMRKRTMVFRAPSIELKAVWQNLIQRQIIRINTTGQELSPPPSPVESSNPLPSESTVTLNTTSKNQQTAEAQINELIDHKCRQIGKSTGKGRAYHLSQWMKGELGGNTEFPNLDSEPDVDVIWSEEDLNRRSQEVGINESVPKKSEQSSSQNTSINIRKFEEIAICQKCRNTCVLRDSIIDSTVDSNNSDPDPFLMTTTTTNRNGFESNGSFSPTDPFKPIPDISITPPKYPHSKDWLTQSSDYETMEQLEESKLRDSYELIEEESRPHENLQKPTLKRYSSFANLDSLTLEDEDLKINSNLKIDANAQQDHNILDEKSQTNNLGEEGYYSWASRASWFVAQKVAMFGKIGENQTSSFLDRCLGKAALNSIGTETEKILYEEEGEASGGTSGDEIWGTPNSGEASLESNECGALSPGSVDDEDEDDYMADQRAAEEMILNRRSNVMLAQVQYQQHVVNPSSRLLSAKTRLETLLEYEEEFISSDSNTSIEESSTSNLCKNGSLGSILSSTTNSECTMSCPTTQTINISNGHTVMYCERVKISRGIFERLKLRRTHSADLTGSAENNKKKSESRGSYKNISRSNRNGIFRLFNKNFSKSEDVSNPNSVSKEKESKSSDSSDRKFWKPFKHRQSNPNKSL